MRLLLFIFICGFTSFFPNVLSADSGTLKINWSELNKQRQKVSARRSPYPEILTKGIAQTTLPVYLPASYAYDPKMSVVADKFFYSITLPFEGAVLVVMGDRSFQQTIPQNSDTQTLLQASKKVQFVHAEGMMTTRFNRFGANYSLTLECINPSEDKRCLQASFLKDFYNELTIVGGHP